MSSEKIYYSLLICQVQAGQTDLSRFQRVVKMIAFHPFESAENALENINAITDHELTDDLRVRKLQILLVAPIIMFT